MAKSKLDEQDQENQRALQLGRIIDQLEKKRMAKILNDEKTKAKDRIQATAK